MLDISVTSLSIIRKHLIFLLIITFYEGQVLISSESILNHQHAFFSSLTSFKRILMHLTFKMSFKCVRETFIVGSAVQSFEAIMLLCNKYATK